MQGKIRYHADLVNRNRAFGRSFVVPDLTFSASIQLNKRV
jgi:hypothetical protein